MMTFWRQQLSQPRRHDRGPTSSANSWTSFAASEVKTRSLRRSSRGPMVAPSATDDFAGIEDLPRAAREVVSVEVARRLDQRRRRGQECVHDDRGVPPHDHGHDALYDLLPERLELRPLLLGEDTVRAAAGTLGSRRVALGQRARGLVAARPSVDEALQPALVVHEILSEK